MSLQRTAGLKPGGYLRRSEFPRTLKPAGTRAKVARDTIPLPVRVQVDARDPWCLHCGHPKGLHRHHRRLKGQGGDTRPHADCACNIVRLCHLCHEWAHLNRREAEAEGLIIPAETRLPGAEGVMVHSADGGTTYYLTCDGVRTTEPGEL